MAPAPLFTRGRVFLLVAAVSAWLCIMLPLFSQESYYWTYAQRPDLSYFDHPPMVAWLIWLGTALFGDGALGVRLGSWLCGLGVTLLGATMLRQFGVGARGQSMWMLLSIAAPILAMTHFLANPDSPLVMCWTLVMFAMWRAREGMLMWWLVAGIAAGGALLSKYTAAFLAASGVIVLLMDPMMRRQLRRPGPYAAVLMASVVFLPVLIWNFRNDFESFRFQTGERFARGELGWHWFLEFIGGQALVFHPVLVVAIGWSVLWWTRTVRRDPRGLWVLAFGLPLPLWFAASSLWIQVKINWLAPACVPLALGAVVWWMERGRILLRRRAARAAVWSLLMVPAVAPLAPLLALLPPNRGTSWTGWEEIAARAEIWEDRLDALDGIEGNLFFFAADYRDAAQLGRSVLLFRRNEKPPEHPLAGSIDFEPTMAQNVLGRRALQYDHWASPRSSVGQDAIFVLPRPQQRVDMVREAAKRFVSIQRVERVEVRRCGVHVLDADIFVCRGYKGPGAE